MKGWLAPLIIIFGTPALMLYELSVKPGFIDTPWVTGYRLR